ncbi:MAG TPA: MATE family efflux transporter [Bacteroidia bacterium]|nr:MATE family efflux transporter [Bacteroidia bacterium]
MKFFSGLSLIKKAIRGEQANITGGSIDRAIILLAVPMILEMAMESLFAVVDIFFVSKISVDAVAIVGLTESMLTIVYSLGWGLAMGATAMIARRVGEKNNAAAAVAAVQAIYIALFISALISIAGIFFSEDILHLMGASAEVIQQGKGFTKIMLTGNFVIMLLFLINGIFRGAGNAALAMRSLWIANIINIVLDPLFIFGIGPFPELGVEGAAVATTIGRATGVLYQLYHLFKGKGIIKIHADNWKVDWTIIKTLINVSAGGTGQFIIASASWIFLMRIMAHFGSMALAGYTIAIRVIVFTILPAWGMANAAATMVGQNLGAKQPDRAEKSVWRAGFFNMVFMVTVMIIFLLFAKAIVSFFTDVPEVIQYATRCLTIISVGYIFFSYGMIVAQSFNGAGDTRTPTILNFFAFWCIQIPLAYLLAITFSFGPDGLFSSIVIAETLLTVAGILIFKRGKWKEVKI